MELNSVVVMSKQLNLLALSLILLSHIIAFIFEKMVISLMPTNLFVYSHCFEVIVVYLFFMFMEIMLQAQVKYF